MTKDIIAVHTGVVFLKLKEDKEVTIDHVTTLQVVNSGYVSVFVNDFELAPKEQLTLIPPDGTISNVTLEIRFAQIDTTTQEFSAFIWNRKEIDIIYKKVLQCKN